MKRFTRSIETIKTMKERLKMTMKKRKRKKTRMNMWKEYTMIEIEIHSHLPIRMRRYSLAYRLPILM